MRLLCLLATLAILGCFAPPAVAADGPAPKKNLVQANNQFALDLYGELSKADGNLFYSPASISVAMSMAMAGAEGQTETEMARALHLDGDEADLHEQFSSLMSHWNAGGRDYQLSVANRLWAQKKYRILDSYLKLTKEQYHAPVALVDFAGNPNGAREEINTWVEEKTNDKIKDLLQPGTIDDLTRLVLTNAIYFKGDWATPFKEEATHEKPFFLSDGKEIKSLLMFQSGKFPYAEDKGVKVLSMPYQGDDLSMVVVLPNDRDGLAAVEKNLSAAQIDGWLNRSRTQKVLTWFPKFKVESSFNLNETLRKLGIRAAFDDSADFSGITGTDDLYITDVVHKAFCEVNEEGTEAAAATAVVFGAKSSAPIRPKPPKEFRADHPFIYLIRDNLSGSILFVGRMENPQG